MSSAVQEEHEMGPRTIPQDILDAMSSTRVRSEKEQERMLGSLYQVANTNRLEKIQEVSDTPEPENFDMQWRAARMSVPYVPFPHSLEDLGTARGEPNSHAGLVELMEEFAVKKRMKLPIADGIFN